MLKNILFHPVFIHFPIAFCFLEPLLLLMWALKKDEAYRRFSFISFRLAYVLMALTVVTGLWDAGGFNRLAGAVAVHFYFGLGLFIFYTARALCMKRVRRSVYFASIQIAGALLGNGLVAATAYFGGKLVYPS